jgi:hypothetical protein
MQRKGAVWIQPIGSDSPSGRKSASNVNASVKFGRHGNCNGKPSDRGIILRTG